ncbi:TetR/AcrR family transcriptional regulator [Corallococcus terminator]
MSSESPETRTRILAAALHLLETSKGQAVRMSDIAREAGLSRQAVYLHFGTRAALLIATTLYLDELKDVRARLVPSRTARSGVERLDAYVGAWADYIPEIRGVAKALMAMGDTDEEAAEAWRKRMEDMREGCAAAVEALRADGTLSPDFTPGEATDLLWTLLSVRNWEHLTLERGYAQRRYKDLLLRTARRLFVRAPR